MKIEKYDAKSSERTFMSGVIVLSVSTVIVKIIGLAYKIPLLNILKTDGMGYFNTAYEIFALLCGVSTSGLPVAVSMLVSAAREMGNSKRERGIYRTASAMLITKGVLFSACLAIFAEPIARAVGNPQSYLAILAISPSLLLSCASGAIRGYFQGCRMMTPTAVSQLTEAAGKLLLGVSFAFAARAAGYGIPVAAAFAVLGVSLGSFASAAYLWSRKREYFKTHGAVSGVGEKVGKYFFELLRISLPITVCSALTGITRIVDMTLMLRRLQSVGISAAQANRIYGAYTTLSLPVFMLVPALIPPITESLIPRLCAAVQSNSRAEQSRALRGAMRLTVFVAMPASMGIALYAEPILGLLFSGQREAIAIGAPMLSALGASVLFSCLISTSNAVLQSYSRVVLPIISLAAGALVKAVSAYFLIGDPNISSLGAPVSTLLSNAAVLMLNVIFVRRTVSGKTGILSESVKPFFSSLVSMTASYCAFLSLGRLGVGRTPAFLVAFAVALVCYLALCVMLGTVSADDLKAIRSKKK